MNQEIKKKWVEALRSGNYPQGRGYLKCEDRYCCLGVLCQIYAEETGKGRFELDRHDKAKFMIDDAHGRYDYLPLEVTDWAGLNETNPYAGQNPLAWLNDNNRTFSDIADLIGTYL